MSNSVPGRTSPTPLLFLTTLVIAACGIVYELIIATISSYLLGDSILQFSLTIGLYMSALGFGAYLSQWFRQALAAWFIAVEVLVGLCGGGSALFLFYVYASTSLYEPAMWSTTIVIGLLVGLEIPLLLRLVTPNVPLPDDQGEPHPELRTGVAFVLSADYLGGLVGSIAFPLILLPTIGLIRTAALIGMGNVAVAGLNLWQWRTEVKQGRGLTVAAVIAAGLLAAVLWSTLPLEQYLEQKLYRDNVVLSEQTPYQHLTITRSGRDTRLFINGALQFSSLDEYRYHEALVHVPLGFRRAAQSVLILGGGDGLAAREVLKYKDVRRVVLVDLDPEMPRLAGEDPVLRELNGESFEDPRLHVIHRDAFKYVEHTDDRFDVVLVDLPDPENVGISKLYSVQFYRLAGRLLQPAGVLVTQSTSPFFAREAFWCINKTMRAAGLQVYPYHLDVPSFGEWGFNLASYHSLRLSQLRLAPLPMRYLKPALLPSLFSFAADEDGAILPTLRTNTLFDPALLGYYRAGWDRMRD